MALVVICGAECGIVTSGLGTASTRHWGAVNGVPTIETTTVRTGSRAIRCASSAVNQYVQRTNAASRTVGYIRAYFRVTGTAPSGTVTIFQGNMAAGANHTIRVTTGGVLEASFAGSNAQNYSGTLVADEWYGLECEFDASVNPNVIRWRVHRVSTGWVGQTDATLAQAATSLSSIRVGQNLVSTGIDVIYDDILIGEGTTVGGDYSTSGSKGGIVKRYKPTSDGTHSFTAGDMGYDTAGGDVAVSATDVNTYVDDDDQTSITDGVLIRQKVIRTTGYCEVQCADEATETSPRAVAVTSTHHASATGANQQGIRIHDGTSEATIWSANDVSDVTAHFRHGVASTPPSGGNWTQALVNSTRIRFGFSGDVVGIPYWDSVSLEVEWQEAAAAVTNPGWVGAGWW